VTDPAPDAAPYDARVRDLLRRVGPILRDAGHPDLAAEAVALWHTAVDLARGADAWTPRR